jgi:glycosyltransferase involved in cell wall biosynthesis
MKSKIAIIGTNGVPSKYGGFETLVEYLVQCLANRYDITVFCSARSYTEKMTSYKGVKLEYVNLDANGWQSILFDMVSLYKSYKRFDKILILGCSGSLIQPFFKKYMNKFIINLGGLDWQRSKWGYFTRKYLKLSEGIGVKYSKYVISDNLGISDYLLKEYELDSILVTYGGDQVSKVVPEDPDMIKYPFLSSEYTFTVARIQPDNNIDLLLNSFDESSLLPFVFVGNWNNSEYGKKTKEKYSNRANLILLDAIYDNRELNLLRSNCKVYLHGHSAGGTNPALVEAMNLALPVFAFDSIFNRYTTNFEAAYFSNSQELKSILSSLNDEDLFLNGQRMLNLAKKYYTWKHICAQYAAVFDM